MASWFCLALISSFVAVCNPADSVKYVALSDQLIEYQVKGDQYVVVIVMDGVSASEAKKMARQRAAEITVDQGGRYFTIDQEIQTQVIKSNEELMGNNRFYGNMYQELIIEGDFGKSRVQKESVPNSQLYPGIRLLFTIYEEKPARGKAIDACKLVDCTHSEK